MFPQASKGLKKLLWGELIQLIAIIALLSINYVAALKNNTVAAGSIAIASLVLLAVATVLSFVGLVQAGKDDSCFRDAWVCFIAYIAGSLIASIIWYKDGAISDHSWISSIIDVIMTSLVFLGMQNLLKKANLEEGYNKTKVAFTVYLIAAILAVAAEIAMSIINVPNGVNNTEDAIMLILFAITALFLIVAYIMYLSALGRTSAQLRDE